MSDSDERPKKKKKNSKFPKIKKDKRTKNVKGRPRAKLTKSDAKLTKSDIMQAISVTPTSSDTEEEPKKNEKPKKDKFKKPPRSDSDEEPKKIQQDQQSMMDERMQQIFMQNQFQNQQMRNLAPRFPEVQPSVISHKEKEKENEKEEKQPMTCRKHTCFMCNDPENVIDMVKDAGQMRATILIRIGELLKATKDPNLIDQNYNLKAQFYETLMRTLTTYI